MSHKIKKVQQQPLQADLYDAAKRIDLIYFILFYAPVYYCFCIRPESFDDWSEWSNLNVHPVSNTELMLYELDL
jgi:hypothetical protein